jgi:hypothetical protein
MSTKNAFLLAAAAAIAVPLFAQQSAPAAAATATEVSTRKTYRINRVEKPIAVDGVIDAAEWNGVAPIEIPFETFPKDNVAAAIKTEAFVGYDHNNLYVAFRAFDPDPKAIRAHLTDRDSAYSDDFLGIAVDTFNDERRAFEFFVNPLGVQMDLTNNDLSGNEDDSWDAIWSSSGKIHGDRYEVEMAIPFSQLRFKEAAGEQTWGIDMLRIYPRDSRYRFGLHPQDRNRSCYVCQFSKLTGFEGIAPGKNIEITPTLTTHRTDSRASIGTPIENGKFEAEPGVTARWGMTPNLTLLGTINPDFSQVEADSAQLDINTTFALFFNEKRPFFLEGADFFESPMNVVYTRTIASPDWGAKLTGKEGRNGGGLFIAQDAVTNILIPGSQGSGLTQIDDKSFAGVARYRYDVGKNNNISALVTARDAGDYSNLVAGIDGLFKLTPRDTITAQAMTSRTKYPLAIQRDFDQPGGTLSDETFYLRYAHSTRNWYWNARHENVGTDFRADSGFMPRVDYHFSAAGVERTWWAANDGKKRWYTRKFWGGDWDRMVEQSTGQELEQEFETWFGFGGPMQSYVSFDVGARDRFFNDRSFKDEQFINIYAEFTPLKQLFAALEINAGDQIDFANTRPATRMRIAPEVRYRASRNLDLNLRYVDERLNVAGGRLFDARQTELRAVYQFNLRTFVRAVVQYTDIERNPSLYTFPIDQRSQDLFPQFLFSYKLNPQTVLFVGYSSSRFGNETLDLTETDRTLFVKIGYAWTM